MVAYSLGEFGLNSAGTGVQRSFTAPPGLSCTSCTPIHTPLPSRPLGLLNLHTPHFKHPRIAPPIQHGWLVLDTSVFTSRRAKAQGYEFPRGVGVKGNFSIRYLVGLLFHLRDLHYREPTENYIYSQIPSSENWNIKHNHHFSKHFSSAFTTY